MRARLRPLALAAALAGLAGCGYRLAGPYRAVGGAERIHVRVFQVASPDPDLAAAFTAALRDELARRGADSGPGAPAVLEGELRASEGVPSSVGAATFRVTLDVHARLTVDGTVAAERTVRRAADHLAGVDALENEARRTLALRRLAAEAAAELVRALER